jgi:hypothetical protein
MVLTILYNQFMDTKLCLKCGVTKTVDNFNKRKKSRDGLQSCCRECHKDMIRKYSSTERGKKKRRVRDNRSYWSGDGERREYLKKWRQSDKGKEMERRRSKTRYQERREETLAKAAVQRAVKKGALPHISEQECSGCGDVAREYHHESYAKEHQLDVVPLCKMCHRATY